MTTDKSRGKDKAAELLWVFIYNSRTNSYYWIVSKQRDGPRWTQAPLPLEELSCRCKAAAAWLTLHPWASSVTSHIECDLDHLICRQRVRGANHSQMGMDGHKFPSLDFSIPSQSKEGNK